MAQPWSLSTVGLVTHDWGAYPGYQWLLVASWLAGPSEPSGLSANPAQVGVQPGPDLASLLMSREADVAGIVSHVFFLLRSGTQ